MNLLCPMLQKFKKEYPQVTVRIETGKMESISLLLKRGLMDFGVVVESDLCNQFDKHIVRKGFFNIYAEKGKHLNLNEGVYVDHCDGLYVDRLLENYRKHFNKELTILQELDSWQVLAKCAENGIGSCFLPDFLIPSKSKLKKSTNMPPIAYKIVAIHPERSAFDKIGQKIYRVP